MKYFHDNLKFGSFREILMNTTQRSLRYITTFQRRSRRPKGICKRSVVNWVQMGSIMMFFDDTVDIRSYDELSVHVRQSPSFEKRVWGHVWNYRPLPSLEAMLYKAIIEIGWCTGYAYRYWAVRQPNGGEYSLSFGNFKTGHCIITVGILFIHWFLQPAHCSPLYNGWFGHSNFSTSFLRFENWYFLSLS